MRVEKQDRLNILAVYILKFQKISTMKGNRTYLGSYHSFQIICHIAISKRRKLLTRYIDQAANFGATDRIK